MKQLLASLLLLTLACGTAVAQAKKPMKKTPSPEKSAPKSQGIDVAADPTHKLVINNAHTRVFRVELAPAASTEMHRHDRDYITISIDNTKARNQIENGPANEQDMSAGQMEIAKAPLVHRVTNEADTPFRVLAVELAGGFDPNNIVCGMGRRACRSDVGDLIDAHQRYSISGLFETDVVRVTQVTIGPGATLPERKQPLPFLRVAVDDLDLEDQVGDAAPQKIAMKPGDVQWLEPGPNHVMKNLGDQEVRFYTIEFK